MTKIIDLRFVGKWKGSDEGKLISGQTNFWLMHRKEDGTFEIIFETHNENGTIEQSIETGNWFVENDLFFECRASDRQIDRYQFEFISTQIIQFIEIDSETNNPYIFKDYKIILN